MARKVFQLSIEIYIHAITCPGVWLCAKSGKVTLCMNMFDTWSETSPINPLFPLLIHEKILFTQNISNAQNLADIENALNDEYLYCELVQWSDICPGKGTILSNFSTCLSNLLYSTNSNKKLVFGIDIELLMDPCPPFPGIISPKIKITTKTTIKEAMSTCKKNCPTYVINPKVIRSAFFNRQDKFRRQHGVCHSDRNRNASSIDDINNNFTPTSACEHCNNQQVSPPYQSPTCLCDLLQNSHCYICEKYQQYFNEHTVMGLEKDKNSIKCEYPRLISPRHSLTKNYQYHARLLHEKIDDVLNRSCLSKSRNNAYNNYEHQQSYNPKEYSVKYETDSGHHNSVLQHSSEYCTKAANNQISPYKYYKSRPITSSAIENRKLQSHGIQRPKSEGNQKKECVTNKKSLTSKLKVKRQNEQIENTKCSKLYHSSHLSSAETDPHILKVRNKYNLEMYKPKFKIQSKIPNDKNNTNFRLNSSLVKCNIPKKSINKKVNSEKYILKNGLTQKTAVHSKSKKSFHKLLQEHKSQTVENNLKNIQKQCTQNLNVNKDVSLKKYISKTNNCVDYLKIMERPSITKLINEKLKAGDLRLYTPNTPYNYVEESENLSYPISKDNFSNKIDITIDDKNGIYKCDLKSNINEQYSKEECKLYKNLPIKKTHPFCGHIIDKLAVNPVKPNQERIKINNDITCGNNTCSVRPSFSSIIDYNNSANECNLKQQNLSVLKKLSENLDEYIKNSSIHSIVNNVSNVIKEIEKCSNTKCLCQTYSNKTMRWNISDSSFTKNADELNDNIDESYKMRHTCKQIRKDANAIIDKVELSNNEQMRKDVNTLDTYKEKLNEYHINLIPESTNESSNRIQTYNPLQRIYVDKEKLIENKFMPKCTEDSFNSSKLTSSNDKFEDFKKRNDFTTGKISKKYEAIAINSSKDKLSSKFAYNDSSKQYINGFNNPLTKNIDCANIMKNQMNANIENTKHTSISKIIQTNIKLSHHSNQNQQLYNTPPMINKINANLDFNVTQSDLKKESKQECNQLFPSDYQQEFTHGNEGKKDYLFYPNLCQQYMSIFELNDDIWEKIKSMSEEQCFKKQLPFESTANTDQDQKSGNFIYQNPGVNSFTSIYNLNEDMQQQINSRVEDQSNSLNEIINNSDKSNLLSQNKKVNDYMRKEQKTDFNPNSCIELCKSMNSLNDQFSSDNYSNNVTIETDSPISTQSSVQSIDAEYSLPIFSKMTKYLAPICSHERMVTSFDSTENEYKNIDQMLIESEIKLKSLIENDIQKYSQKPNFRKQKLGNKIEQIQTPTYSDVLQDIQQNCYKIHESKKKARLVPKRTCDNSNLKEDLSEKDFEFLPTESSILCFLNQPSCCCNKKNNFKHGYRSQFYTKLEKFYKMLHRRAQNQAEKERKLCYKHACKNFY